jgi:hypothetical protein
MPDDEQANSLAHLSFLSRQTVLMGGGGMVSSAALTLAPKLIVRKEHLVEYQFQFPTTCYALLVAGKLTLPLHVVIRS